VDKVVIADLGIEGGGATILGTRINDRWSFWYEGSSIALDANDDEEWRAWASAQEDVLASVVPSNWPLMFPITIHPNFVGWFRDNYEAARAGLSASTQEYQTRHPHWRWQGVFSGGEAERCAATNGE
jgi:hypothetical protein